MAPSRNDRDEPITAGTRDVPDWGSATEPAEAPTGLPGNPGYLNPRVPAFAMRDRRGRAIVETPLTPGPAARHRAGLVVLAGAVTAVVAGITLTLLAGHLLGAGALPDGRSAPWWLVAALAVVALVACVLLLGVHTVTLSLSGSTRVASGLTWSTVLLAVALGVGAVVGLDLAGIAHPLVHDLDPYPFAALLTVTVLGVAWGAVAVLSTIVAMLEARAMQERLRALRRDGVRSPGTVVHRRYLDTWTDDGRPRFDAVVTYGPPGVERRVDLLLVTPQDRVPLPGAPVVVVHEGGRAAGASAGYGTAPERGHDAAPRSGPRDADLRGRRRRGDRGRHAPTEIELVLVEIDQSRPVDYDPDVAAYARKETESGS